MAARRCWPRAVAGGLGHAHTVQMIEQLQPPVAETDLEDLAQLLVDAVDSAAAVSFVAPLTVTQAREWWLKTIADADARAIVLVARDATGIIGTVQLQPAWAPNQPHRAEVVKRSEERGVGKEGGGRGGGEGGRERRSEQQAR